MSDDAKKPDIKLVEPPVPESVFDDVEALRKVATLKVSRRVVPVNVAVRSRQIVFTSVSTMIRRWRSMLRC
jgi:hypothetical protein